MQRHRRSAFVLPASHRTGLSFIALAVSLALTGCAGNNGSNAANSQAPTGTIGPSTLNVADAAIAGGDPSMALSVSQSILASDPDNVDALVHEGDAYYALGRCPASEAAYQLALKSDPKSADAESGLGRCLLKVNPAQAEVAFLAATQDDPGDGAAFSNLGIARDLEGNYAGAAAAYQQSLLDDPSSTATAVNLGLSMALSGQGQEALQYLGPIATGPGATPKIREDYAMALVAAGRDDDARQVLAIDMTPDGVNQAMAGYQSLIAANVAGPGPAAPPAPTEAAVPTVPVAVAPASSTPVPLAPTASAAPADPPSDPPAPSDPAPYAVTASAPPPPVPTAAPAPVTAPPVPQPVAVAKPVMPAKVAEPVATASVKAPPVPEVSRPTAVAVAAKPVTTGDAADPIAAEDTANTAAAAVPVTKVAAVTPVPPAPVPAAPAPVTAAKPVPAVPSPEEVAEIKPVTPAPVAAPELAPEPAAAPAAMPIAGGSAAVQIAALNTQDAAQAEWREVSAKAPSLFAGKEPEISKVEVGGQTYYRLRIAGFSSHEDAAQFCSQLTAAGGPCMPANF